MMLRLASALASRSPVSVQTTPEATRDVSGGSAIPLTDLA